MINESIVVGLVIGVGVSVVGTLVSHFVRKREMDRLWAEEERRRKSDRRRDLYERELKIVSDSVDAIIEAEGSLVLAPMYEREARKSLLKEAFQMMMRAYLLTVSLEHEELKQAYKYLMESFTDWFGLLDLDSGEAKEGKEEEVRELLNQMHLLAATVPIFVREILEEV